MATLTAGSLAQWDREMAESPATFDSIARFLPVMFYRFSATAKQEFKFRYVSPYSLVLTGFSPHEILADFSPLVERFHPEDVSGLRAHLMQAMRNKTDWLHEFRFQHRDGHFLWIRSHDSRSYAGDGSCEGIGYWVDISAHKAAEEQARAAEDRYRALAENAVAGIAVISRQHRYLFVNESFARMFGYEQPDDLLALADNGLLIHPEDRPRLAAYNAARSLGEEAPTTYEARGVRQDGSELWFSASVRLASWQEQQVTLLVCVDITERRIAEAGLRKSEERYKDLIENSRLGFMVQRDLRFLYANRAYAEMFGYSDPREVLALGGTEGLVHPDDRERLMSYHAARGAGRPAPAEYEFRGVRKDGSVIWLNNTIRKVEWEGLPANQTTTVNITARKLAEQALRASEERYRDLIENSPQGIVIHADLQLRFVNSTFVRMLGYEHSDEVLARGTVMAFVHPEDQERLLSYQKARSHGEPAPTEYEVRAVRKDGGTIWISAVIRRIDWEGSPATQAICTDITERRRAEQALRESEQRYRRLVDSSLQGIVVIQQGICRFANAAEATLLGYATPGELIGRSADGWMAPEFLEKALSRRRRALAGEAVAGEILRMVRKDGAPVWVMADLNVIEWEGKPALQSLHVNVTDRYLAEQALREREQQYRYLLENSLQGISVSREGVILYANEAEARIWGFERPEQIVGWRFRDRLKPEYTVRMAARDNRPVGQRLPAEEIEAIRNDGSPLWLETSAITIPWGGQTAKLSAHIDITERKRTEHALQESEARYRGLVENSVRGIAVVQDDVVVFANPAHARIFGAESPEDEIGKNPARHFAPEELPDILRRREAVLRGETVPTVERRATRADGTPLWLQASMSLVEWNGRPAFQVVHHDITERKRAELALRESEQRYRHLVETSVQGIAVMRHGVVLYANDAAARMWGFEGPDHMTGLQLRDRVKAQYLPLLRARDDRPAGEKLPPIQYEALRLDGTSIWLESTAVSVEWEGERAKLSTYIDITERLHAEEAVRASQQRLLDLFESSSLAILVHRDFRPLFVNQACAELYGYSSREEMLRQPDIRPSFVPGGLEQSILMNKPVLAGQRNSARRERRFIRANGEHVWVDCLINRIEWEGQTSLVVSYVDVTERKRTEQALRASEQRYRDLVEESIQGIAVTKDGHYVFANKAEAEIFGFASPVQMLGVAADSLYTDESNSLRHARRAQMATGVAAGPTEFEAIRRDGGRVWIETRTRIIDWEGTPAFMAVHLDITERRSAAHAMAESRGFLSAVLDNAADGVITIDQDGMVEYFNRQAARIFGYSREEVVGNNVSMLVPEPHRQKHPSYLERYLETGQSQIIGVGRDTVGIRKDGSTVPVSIDVSEVRTATRVAFTAIVKDISDQKRQERDLLAMAQAKSAMLSNLSHELRSPLTAILGFAQLMKGEVNLTEGQRKDVKTIEEAARHLLDLMNDVLDIQKMEAGFQKLNLEDFDLNHTLESLVSMFRPRCEAKRVALALQIDPRAPRYVSGDPRKLRQVLINLLGNAAKFVQSGEIALIVRPVPNGLLFAVKDTGPGIAAQELKHLMKPFRQASGAKEGTGLGLSISKGLVEVMGGRLEAVSEVGVGSEFSFVLALTGPDQSVQVLGAGDEAVVAGHRVLVVEDDPAAREWLVRLLLREGYRVEQAENGKQAIRRFIDSAPHIAIMDLHMPVMDGMEAAARMRAMRGGAALTILALSGDDAAREQAEALPDGRFDRVLAKPIAGEHLLAVLKEYLPQAPRQLN